MASVFFQQALVPGGWARDVRIMLADGHIEAVQAGAQRQPGDDVAAIGLPGIGNLHSHAFQRGMAGLAETRGPGTDSFWTWREVMYRFVGRVTPDDLEALAAQAYMEMLESGFTRVGEFHYLHHDIDGTPYADIAEMGARIAAAATETGIGLTLLPVFYAHGGFGKQKLSAAQGRFFNNVERYAKLFEASKRVVAGVPGAVIGVAPHSLRAAAADELGPVVAMAGGGPVHIHVAEQTKEVDDCVAFCGARPVEWLLANQQVDARWCLIHATHMTDSETIAMAKTGAVAGLCPITEANLGDGVFNAPTFLDAGGVFGVGSDSNLLISLGEELRLLENSQRLKLRTRNVISRREGGSTGRALFDGALKGGGQAFGSDVVGLVPGASADFVSLDAEHDALFGRSGDQLLDGLIFAARNGGIDTVWSRGRKVVSAGRHIGRDAISARFKCVMTKLLA